MLRFKSRRSESLTSIHELARAISSVEEKQPNNGVSTRSFAQTSTPASAIIPLPLPYELQSLVLSHLTFTDILSLRLTSRKFYALTLLHQNELARSLSPPLPPSTVPCACTHIPGTLRPTIPSSDSVSESKYTISTLLTHHRRAAICTRLANTLTDLVYSKFLRIEIRPGVHTQLDAMRGQLLNRIDLSLRHLQVYLLQYRHALLSAPAESIPTTSSFSATDSLDLQLPLLQEVSTTCLYDIHCVAHILNSALSMKLRPPSYASFIERVARRWTKDGSNGEEVVKLILCGGLEGLDFVLNLRPYALRIEAMRHYMYALEDEYMRAPMVKGTRGVQHRAWWVVAAGPGAKTGAKVVMEEVLSLETRRRLFQRLPMVEDVFLRPTGRAVSERMEAFNAEEMNVVGALDHLAKMRARTAFVGQPLA